MRDHIVKAINLGEDKKESWWTNYDRPWVKLWYWLEEVWWTIVGKHINYLTKVFSYAKVLRRDYDFDAHSLYPLLSLKLKRIEKALLKGCSIHEKKDMQALRICIKLCDRLDDDETYDKWRIRHDKKWGELESTTVPVDVMGNTVSEKDANYFRWDSWRARANTPELKEQERQEMRAGFILEEKIKLRERKWFFNILAEKIPYWWD